MFLLFSYYFLLFLICPIYLMCCRILSFNRVARPWPRDVHEYRIVRMIGIPKEYGRYIHKYTYSTHICWYVSMFLLCLPPPQPPYKGGGLRPPPQRGAAAFGGRPPLWIPLWMARFPVKLFNIPLHLPYRIPYKIPYRVPYSIPCIIPYSIACILKKHPAS